MSTTQELIAATQTRLHAILEGLYPNALDFGDGSYTITQGTTSVVIVVRPFTESNTIVELMVQVVTGISITPALSQWLLRKNVELHFGAFGLLFDDSVVFTYSLPGLNIGAADLEAAIMSVAVIADHYDDEIVALG